MTTVIPYIDLGRATEEALAFYTRVFHGEVTTLIRWRDAMKNPDEADANRVIHSELRAGDLHFAVSDAPREPVEPGLGRVSLALNFDDRAEQDRVFAGLSEAGDVLAQLHDTFYGGRMGVIRDRFGVQWLLNWVPAQD